MLNFRFPGLRDMRKNKKVINNIYTYILFPFFARTFNNEVQIC
jgi:hypothetical protein